MTERIYYTKTNGDIVFGALNVEITKFLTKFKINDTQSRYYFNTKNHGNVWLDRAMLERVLERFRVNKIATDILLEALRHKDAGVACGTQFFQD